VLRRSYQGYQGCAHVAHSYHSSYSGGRDQEDWGLKPAWAKEFARPYLVKKKPITEKVWLKV
jgi:hypothetical protein